MKHINDYRDALDDAKEFSDIKIPLDFRAAYEIE